MLILTGGSHHKPYDRTIKLCQKKCEEYGYKFKVYDLGGLGFGIPYSDPRLAARNFITRCAMKPNLIRETLKETNESLLVWIDGDATLIRPIDELEKDDSFDVGVTVRPRQNPRKTNYINAGVMFFKNNSKAKTFLDAWIDAFPPVPILDSKNKREVQYHNDQNVIEEELLLPNIEGHLYDQIQSIHEVHGARVKLFSCVQYNNFMCTGKNANPPGSDVKILHFKGRHYKTWDYKTWDKFK